MGKNEFKDYQSDFTDDYSQGEPEIESEEQQAAKIQIKISDDGGETWERSTLDISTPIEESALRAGQLLILNGERFEVCADDWGDIGLKPVKNSNKKGGKR